MTARQAAAALALLALACVRPARWSIPDEVTPELVEILVATDQPDRVAILPSPETLAAIPVRQRLRPCCAFGSDLRVSAGSVPIPGYRLPNLLGPEDVGPHTYDAGIVHQRREGDEDFGFGRENNGLLYTCRGGFIDTAHVRDYLDWAVYLTAQLGAAGLRGEPGVIALPDEGGARRVRVGEPPPAFASDPVTTTRVTAQWLAFQLSIWHEIATWYGFQSVPGFSELASAFSPEDFYSNLVGVKLAGIMVHRPTIRSEPLFNRAATQWIAAALAALGAVPRDVARDAMNALDGVWWDSKALVSDKRLLLRRNFGIGDPIEPWRVPEALAPASLRAACAGARPAALRDPSRRGDFAFASWATLEIEVDPEIAAQPGFPKLGPVLTQADFPAIVAAAAAQNREEAGPDADRP